MTPTRAILALAALFVAATLAAWGVFVVTDHDRAMRDARQELTVMAGLLAEHTHRTLQAVDLLLQRLERQVARYGMDRLRGDEDAFEELAALAGTLPQVASLWVLGPDGRVIANSLSQTGEGSSLADREYFSVLRQGAAEPWIGNLMDPESPVPSFFSMSRRIRPAGTADARGGPAPDFAGVVLAALHLEYFRRFYRDLRLPGGSTLALLRDDATLLLREPPVPEVVGKRVPGALGDLSPERPISVRVENSPIDGVERLVVRQRVADASTVVLASRPMRTILANWRERLAYTGVLVAVLLVAVATLVPIGLRAVRTESRLREEVHLANVGLEQAVALRTAELERALADKNLLLSEVYHRVKNNLQLVEALLSMQSARLSDEQGREAFAATRRRINTLGLVHQQLLQAGDLATLDLQVFLSALCGNISFGFGAEERGIDVAVSADPVVLDLDRAIPLGLLVNELVSNAFKHAFPDGGGGAVTVTATRRADGGLILEVADTGVGWAPTPEGGPEGPVRSSGDRIIRALVAQLGGGMTVTRERGTDVRVDLPDLETAHGR
ncbi:sensor histidine kinase [Caenispirillum bisanense]|uniref:histidine kinase n=1 Tax=Caenispirillum bisanense TaxID=414052 RepID=A0A286GJH3_9PROT|nr:histidine kinase dimerization/phosphoacceptor domain -containing protein [Caenispirillum bisanense]SOD95269.1 Two-component sensor histidine kinase, contains HisKA and HATPase domains [Caenispirillum bisanense]